ncbi:MAG: glycosyltransferase family 2 protein [Dethiobacteria bacterium]|jgi:glycosyltransferase involved in cell wall biosynthesis
MEVLALIPAYNEEKTIGNVLQTLKQVSLITKIIVVSDGSTDNTVSVAKSYDVEVVELRENLGKGGAMQAGLNSFKADVVLFLDADLLGLTPQHVHNLLEPVLNDEADMTIGIFDRGRIATDLAQKMAPYLSGQRALKFSLLEEISDLNVARFGVELALNRYIENSGVRVKEVTLLDMSHVMKEEKMGVWKGMVARMKMYWEILKYFTLADSKIKIK